jgi:AraC-like DNA-binding protein
MSLAVRFINENITDDISVDAIARAANMSKYHFCRSFKRAGSHRLKELNSRIS